MKNILWIIIFLSLGSLSFAAFEEKPISPRITGMGETFSAIEGGIDGIFYSPAIFEAKEEKNEVFTSKTELFGISELKQNLFAYGRTFFLNNRLGFGIQRFGNDIYYEEVKLLNLFRRFMDNLDIGINVKEMNLKIESLDKYSAIGIDGGFQVKLNEDFRIGSMARNFNRPRIMDNLPVIYRIGISCSIFEGIIFAFDWEKEENFEDNFHLGQEICLNSFLFLRSGYETQPSRAAGGLGIKIKPVQIDYSIFSHPVLGNTQIFSLIMGW
ncbi:MAG: hypothetical protein AB1498_01010 [bacterium]